MLGNRKGVFIILSFLMAVLISSYVLILAYYNRGQERLYQFYSDKLEDEYNIIVDIYSEMSALVFHNNIDVEPVLTYLHRAYGAVSDAERNRARSDLFEYINPVYRNIIRYNFRQLHFHDRDNVSFLRVHKPDTFGDDLTGIRMSVELVNRDRTPVAGFEEGRIFNGYRNVFPLARNGENLGSVEISFSMKVLISQFSERFQKETQFILLKSVMEDKVFHSEQENYTPWKVDNLFVLDNSVSECCILEGKVVSHDRGKISGRLRESLQKGEDNFSLHIFRGEGMVLSFLAIRNFENDIVAYLFTRSDDGEVQANQRSFLILSLAFLFLFLTLLSFAFHYNYSEKKIEEMLIHDHLTGASTRRVILEALDSELSRYKRYGSPFCICMIDIDFFKAVNDTHGHLTGDLVLSGLSRIIMRNIRNTDVFGRYGGEEFLLILPETTVETAYQVIDNLRKEIAQNAFPGVGQVTISCGIAQVGSDIDASSSLIEKADMNLYRAKESGRNRTVY